MKWIAAKLFVSAAMVLAEALFIQVSPGLALALLLGAGTYLLWCAQKASTDNDGPRRPRRARRSLTSFFRRKLGISGPDDYSLRPVLAWLCDHGVKAEIRRHEVAKELEHVRGFMAGMNMAQALDGGRLDPELLCGPHQVIASGPRGKISIIIGDVSFGQYEIYCVEGGLFDDVRRYASVEEVGHSVMSLLESGLFYFSCDA